MTYFYAIALPSGNHNVLPYMSTGLICALHVHIKDLLDVSVKDCVLCLLNFREPVEYHFTDLCGVCVQKALNQRLS